MGKGMILAYEFDLNALGRLRQEIEQLTLNQ
jgi:hypothetical protein